ncbi:MAG: hypothetical protein MUF07_11510 [Steroidobacteraceae bacterium]|jgi:uncharacterized repeat protein (TIGR01451 family)|nr:hypothetical protein [Steroidobacteraceae bacterium]
MSRLLLAGAGLALVTLLSSRLALAAGAPAGLPIDNTAQVAYTIGTATVTEPSNTVRIVVAEVLDVTVTLQSPALTVSPGASNQALVYRVTNTGNGSEPIRLTVENVIGGDQFDPVAAVPAIYFDTDGSGSFTPADTPYAAGSNDPLLAADASTTVLVVNSIPTGLADGARGLSQLRAAALTGTGAPGTVFAGQGAAGTDALAGTTGGDGDATGEYRVADLRLAAVKSATVLDPFGGARPVPRAQVTYQVVVTPTGSGSATGVVFTDPIPPSTTYVPASLRLNGAPLSDAADADAGSYLATPTRLVRVALGDLTQSSGPQTITFVVTID